MVVKVKTEGTTSTYRHTDCDSVRLNGEQLIVSGETDHGVEVQRVYNWENVMWYEE